MTSTREENHPARYHVAHLRPDRGVAEVDPAVLARVFAAPWQTVSRVVLGPDRLFGERDLDNSEGLVFVTAGSGRAQLAHGPVDLREGISLTLFKGERLEIRAGMEGPLEFFFVEIRERRSAGAPTESTDGEMKAR